MQGINRTLVNPPVSSREAFASLDAAKATREALEAAVAAQDLKVIDTAECPTCESWFYSNGLQCDQHGGDNR